MSQVDPALEARARANPETVFAVIVRVTDDMDARQVELQAAGLDITRRLWLVRGFAGNASGAAICALATRAWIVSIEPDIEMRALAPVT